MIHYVTVSNGCWKIPTEFLENVGNLSPSLIWNLLKQNGYYLFLILSPGGVEVAACRWIQEGIPLFRHNMM